MIAMSAANTLMFVDKLEGLPSTLDIRGKYLNNLDNLESQ
jgi:hypothetical protein